MADFSKVDSLAEELKINSGHKRITAIENTVMAGKALVKKGEKITPATIAKMVNELGLKSPSKQTLYNAKDIFEPLLNLLSEHSKDVGVTKPKSHGDDATDIMGALPSIRLKSMFNDILVEKDKLAGENRRLGNFLKEIKSTDLINSNAENSTELVAIENKSGLSTEAKGAIRNFIEVMENEGYDFEEDDIYIDGRPLLVQSFVKLIQDLK